MSSRLTLLVLVLAAIALLVVSCQKESNLYSPTSADPGNLLGPGKGGPVTYVYPSGVDDAAQIQSALDGCEPGGTVMLAEGTFHLGSAVQVDDFHGALRGAGKENTVVTTVPGAKISPIFLHIWETMGSVLFYFHGDGDVTVSDLSIIVTDPAPSENNYTGDALLCMLLIDGLEVNSNIERVRFRGASGSWYGFNVGWGTIIAGYSVPPHSHNMSGSHRMEHCDYETIYSAVNPMYHEDATLVIKNNMFVDVAAGISLADLSNCDTKISRNEFIDPVYGAIGVGQGWNFGSGLEVFPSRFLIDHNIISNDGAVNSGAVGIQLVDYWFQFYSRITAMVAITNNRISLDTQWGGIYDISAQDVVVTNNIFQGTMMSAMFPGMLGSGTGNWTILGNNVQNYRPYFEGFDVAIWLGPLTSECTVVGGSNKTNVFDEGTDNILVGVTKVGGEGLGQKIKEGMQQKKEIRGAMMPW
jgi:hypothetical protein